MSVAGWAQNLNISGRVANADGEPVVGASVSIKGTTQGVITGINGDYDIQAPADAALVFSFLGMGSQTEAVNGRARIDITLNGSTTDLDEVVVVGYGSVRKGDLTTAVATVSTKDIDQRPITSAGQAIQGKAAGVQVMQPSGRPGADLSIRVRGATSFNGSNDPLYVVDGVPVDNINFLSPNDIESMQILKDASSAAIYGSRAANGVILISTKSGGKGTAKVTFSAQVGVDKVANRIETLNAKQYQELMNEISPGAVPDDAVNDVTDWYKEVYQTGITQNYQLSVSGGSDKLNYFLSGGYLDQQGIIQSAFFKRYSFRSNVNGQVRQWLDVGANVSYSDNRSNGIGTENNGANRSGLVMAAIMLPTSRPVYDNTGLYNHSFYGANLVNPVEAIHEGKDDGTEENRLIASGHALITLMPGLTFKSMLTLDRRHNIYRRFDKVLHATGEDGMERNQYGYGEDTRNRNTVMVWDNVANWNKSLGKNNFDLMAGTSWTTSDYTNSYLNGSDYRNNDIKTLNAANRVSWNGSGTGAAQWVIMSYFGRVAYNFDSKYLATVNIRADGSSKLHPDHRWGVFPSFSAAWRISSEEFMASTKSWLDDLKIRGGWGQTGNQSGVGDYAYLQRYNISRQDWLTAGHEHEVPVISPANLRTADLTWETTSQTDIGIDLTVLKGRLAVAMDYYYKRTTDMLMYVSLPAGAGVADNIVRNEGVMTNQGFELTINSRNFTGEFAWNTDFNISLNRNKLESLEMQKIYYTGNHLSEAFYQEYVVRNEPGRPLSGFYGYVSDGVDPETGELIYHDANEDGRISSSDRRYIGDPNPDFIFGMTNTFSWKGLSLSIFLQGSYGNDIFNAAKADYAGMQILGWNQSTDVINRWRTPGQITDVPKAGFQLLPSTYFVEDGSYLRIKDITLSYNLQTAFLKKIGVSRLQPYITARNLLTITNYSGMDPEVNSAATTTDKVSQGIDFGVYPHTRSFMVGVNIEF
ncbi:SusC/RagA family TonB-linked outer membrane protein [Bacteroidia bacterium]|nr:SusC/RagA family TonB-linked outer membrane protein [Bacteroidia bacterium]